MEVTKIIDSKTGEILAEFSREGVEYLTPGLSFDDLCKSMEDTNNWYTETGERSE